MIPLELAKPLTKAQKARVVAVVKRAKTRNEIAKELGFVLPTIHQTKGLVMGISGTQPIAPEFAPHAAYAAINPTLEKIRSGIPFEEFESMAKKLGVTREELARKIGMSSATLTRRRRTNAALDPDYGDRLVRFQRLLEQTTRLFDGNEDHARNWLKCPQRALAYQRPIDVAETEAGAREVENILGRLEYGELT